jgi:hypothetical protein
MSVITAAGSILIMALAFSVICRTFAQHRVAVLSALLGELPPRSAASPLRPAPAPLRRVTSPLPAPMPARVAA